MAETKRVLSEAFIVLSTMPAGEVLALLAKGVQRRRQSRGRSKRQPEETGNGSFGSDVV